MVDPDEAELIERASRGDHGAFGALVDAHGRVVYNVALRMVRNAEDARDISQIVFVKAYEKLGTFDRRSRFFSWIYRIAINEALNLLRSRKRHDPLDESILSTDRTPDRRAEASEEESMVQNAMADLSIEHREVIVLRHFLGLSHREMGELLHLPEKTVKSRLFSARGRLGQILQKRGYRP